MQDYYRIGGTLDNNSRSYVERQADEQLYQALLKGHYSFIFNSRQMGKSSLRIHVLPRLNREGIDNVSIDLTLLGSESVTVQSWYEGLVIEISDQLTWADFDVDDWLENQAKLSPVQVFSRFIDKILIPRLQQPLVIFIDEVDTTLSLPFKVNDFFAVIRAFYNRRSEDARYHQLTFVMLGVASPADLIGDKQRTPFNIGTAIELQGLQLAECDALLAGLKAVFSVALAERGLAKILEWTGGQPFLTQKLCQQLLSYHANDKPLDDLDAFIKNELLPHWQTYDDPPHFKTINDRLIKAEPGHTPALLGLYQQILQQPMVTDGSELHLKLQLTGLVVARAGQLELYNPIYRAVFNQHWLEDAQRQLRPYAESLNAWLESKKKDDSRLLTGNALRDAQAFANQQNLSPIDYQFLQKSHEQDQRQQRQRNAEEQRQRLQQQKDLAMRVIKKFTYDVPKALANIPQTGRLTATILEYNIKSLDEIYTLNPEDQKTQREKAVNFINVGDLYLDVLGDVNKALDYYQQGLAIAQKIAAADPNNPSAPRDLSVSFEKMGDIYQPLNQTDKVLDYYQQALQIFQKIAAADSNNPSVQRSLSVSFNNMADIYQTLNQTDKALDYYQQALQIRQKIAATDPNNPATQYDLSVSFERMGGIYETLNQTDKALDYYQQSLQIRQKIAATDPNNPATQYDLSVSFDNMGDIYETLNQTDKALDYYQQALKICQKIAESDVNNSAAQRSLSVSFEKMADIYKTLNQTDKALDYYQQALQISQKIAAADPNNAATQRDLSVSFGRMGDIYQTLNQTDKALDYYQQALQIFQKIAAADPNNSAAQRDLSVSFDNMGDIYQTLNQTDKALDYYQQALQIFQKIAAADPNNSAAQRALYVSYIKLGGLEIQLNNNSQAKAWFTKALPIAKILAQDKINHQAQQDLKIVQDVLNALK